MISFPIPCPVELRSICNDWHSGQTSAMYSVLSTGRIHDADTLMMLSCELSYISGETGDVRKWEDWCDAIIADLPD